MTHEKGAPASFIVLLAALVALPALGTDMFLPVLPVVAQSLSVPVSAAQLTVTAFFGGLAAGQLLWGPLSDRYGRKPVLLAALAIMLLTSAAALFVNSVTLLAGLRLAQGLAMSSGSVVARSVVRDVYANEQAARVLATMTVIFSIVPIAAPLTGAFLAVTSGWRGVFVCLAVAAVGLLAAVAAGLRETAPAARRSAHPAQIARTFAAILREPRFLAPYLLVLSAHIGVLAWVSSSSFALVVGLGVPTGAYGWMCALVMLGQISGAWAASRLVLGHGMAHLLRLGAALMLASGAAAGLLAWGGVAHWSAVVLPYMVFLFGTALIVPNATALALGPFPGAAGSAASVIGATGYAAGALLSAALGAAFDGSARPMATVAALAGAAAFILERQVLRGKA